MSSGPVDPAADWNLFSAVSQAIRTQQSSELPHHLLSQTVASQQIVTPLTKLLVPEVPIFLTSHSKSIWVLISSLIFTPYASPASTVTKHPLQLSFEASWSRTQFKSYRLASSEKREPHCTYLYHFTDQGFVFICRTSSKRGTKKYLMNTWTNEQS